MMVNQNIRVTKKFTFDMAHALYGHDGLCKNIHGHTYHLSVTLVGRPLLESGPKNGMVIDFADFKEIVRKKVIRLYDHALVLNARAGYSDDTHFLKHFDKVQRTDYQPTCENMVCHIAESIRAELPATIALHNVRLEETPTSYAEWFASDNV